MSEVSILIVDDKPDNIGVLFNFLRSYEYNVLIANDGESALELLREEQPDIILLDVMMPGLDGFEVCRRIKAMPNISDIPVIFMTALTDTTNKLEGFEAGGVDYITKPFQQEELLARIKAQTTIYHLQQALREKNAELEAFAHTVAHDLKNPLNTIMGCVELLEFACGEVPDPDVPSELKILRSTAAKASDIIESLLLLAGTSRHRQLETDTILMEYIIPKVKDRLAKAFASYDATLIEAKTWPPVIGYPAWLEEVWVNYLTNALKYGGRPPHIEIGADTLGDKVRFWVKDNGPGLSATQQQQLFTPFIRLHHDRADGHGLGLSIVHDIIAKLGGEVGIESTPGQGSTFFFILPAAA